MNLALLGIEADFGPEHADTFRRDLHPDLRADYVLANGGMEAMARALVQSWFVDFDPVRARLERRQPTGLDKATAARSPASFRESELGHIPKGWHIGKVAEVSDFSRSSINPGESPEETFDHYSLPAFDEGRTPKAEPGSAIMSNKLHVAPNSVLLSKLNPHIPRIWLPDLHATRRSLCSTEFIVASTRPDYSREFLFSLFNSAPFAIIYGTLVTGTPPAAINVSVLKVCWRLRPSFRRHLWSRCSPRSPNRCSTRSIATPSNSAPSPPCATRCCRNS